MSDLERRAILGAAGIGAIAAMSRARGPLSPPAGAVVSTGRTLDEIYNKIPVVGGGDGRIPVSASGSITSPGSYVLTANIDSLSTALTIVASDVTLDLNGYRISAPAVAGAYPLSLSGSLTNITVRNGTLSGGIDGINASADINGLLLEDLRIQNARQNGISLLSANGRNHLLRRCFVMDTGTTTTASDGSLAITAINLGGDSHRVEECTVSRLFYRGSGAGTLRGIVITASGASSGCMVSRCCVSHEAGLVATGITMGGFGVYRDNTVIQFQTPYSAAGATNGGGNV